MNDRDQRRADAAKRAQTFSVENDADFAERSAAKTRFTKLDTALANLGEAKAGQVGGGNASKVALIDSLRIDCRNIRRTAAAIAQETPGFAGDLPPAEHSDAGVLTTADAYLTKLEVKSTDRPAFQAQKTALAQQFIDQELPATFVADFALTAMPSTPPAKPRKANARSASKTPARTRPPWPTPLCRSAS